MTTPRITDFEWIGFEVGLSTLHPGEGFVTIRVKDDRGNVVVGQVDPLTARKIGSTCSRWPKRP